MFWQWCKLNRTSENYNFHNKMIDSSVTETSNDSSVPSAYHTQMHLCVKIMFSGFVDHRSDWSLVSLLSITAGEGSLTAEPYQGWNVWNIMKMSSPNQCREPWRFSHLILICHTCRVWHYPRRAFLPEDRTCLSCAHSTFCVFPTVSWTTEVFLRAAFFPGSVPKCSSFGSLAYYG